MAVCELKKCFTVVMRMLMIMLVVTQVCDAISTKEYCDNQWRSHVQVRGCTCILSTFKKYTNNPKILHYEPP